MNNYMLDNSEMIFSIAARVWVEINMARVSCVSDDHPPQQQPVCQTITLDNNILCVQRSPSTTTSCVSDRSPPTRYSVWSIEHPWQQHSICPTDHQNKNILFVRQITPDNNITTSILQYVASMADNQKYLTCRAENSLIPGSAREDGIKLNILC